MKRTLFLFLSLMLTMVISAGNVTPEEALQQATKFIKERSARGARRAPAATSRLTMLQNVCGLYVVNVGQNDGYVIVSPDDRTEVILGYADSGTLDPDNMPDNMRSWLQGYADEIKWMDEHNYQPSRKAAPRTLSAVKEPIAPLITAQWNQDEPYNNQVKTYAPDGIHGVSGCVTTAMAQVMYFTAKQAGLTTSTPTMDISSYIGKTSKKRIPGVSADEVIRWDLMRDTYNAGDTDEGADAVAALMRICGAAMRIDYKDGYSSGQGEDIYKILRKYFGYAETAQVADRSYYSYSNWIEMLYNELKQGRAMTYSGQSTGGGHDFVCDGYQGEDYFHINWGWGGMCDGYYQLSVMKPPTQGIGGSSSADGYSTGQHVTVGIQLKGGTGTVLNHPNLINLTLNSVKSDKTVMTVGDTAHITFNVTNNSRDDFDGELGFWFLIDDKLGHGKMFVIPAGGTKDCVIDFCPTSAGTYWITAFQTNGEGKYTTVNDYIYVKITVKEGGGINPVSDEIKLVNSLVLENSEPSKFFGTTFKGTLTLTNPEPDTDYSGWCEYVFLESDGGPWKQHSYEMFMVNVPANGSVNIPIEYSGLVLGNVYGIQITRWLSNHGYWTSWEVVGDEYYECTPGVTTYAADGAMSVISFSETSLAAPAGVLFVDIRGTGITDVTHVEPNCTFLTGKTDAVPTGATNYVLHDGSNYTATNLTLTDGYDFYTPVDFTASNIEFTYNCDRWFDGTNGWNTIMLPFDVTKVTADGTEIKWFNSSTDSGKQFWLKEFVGDETSTPKVYFDYVWGDMKANTPYIIALPDNHWGAENDLSGKTIKFIGSGTVKKSAPVVVTAGNYRFVGDTKAVSDENIYCINAAGNKFELKATGGSAAFRSFFKPGIFDRDIESSVPSIEYIAIDGSDETTDIGSLTPTLSKGEGVVYDLQGRKVANGQKPTAKGLYILNGKKVIFNK